MDNIIRDVSASIFARQEMGLVDFNVEEVLVVVKEELATRLSRKDTRIDDYSFLAGCVMMTIMYEGNHKCERGEFTEFLDYSE